MYFVDVLHYEFHVHYFWALGDALSGSYCYFVFLAVRVRTDLEQYLVKDTAAVLRTLSSCFVFLFLLFLPPIHSVVSHEEYPGWRLSDDWPSVYIWDGHHLC